MDARNLSSVAISRDDRFVVTGSFEPGKGGAISLWELPAFSLVRTFKGHTSFIQGLAFSPDGLRIASGSNDGSLCIREVDSGEELYRFEPAGEDENRYVYKLQYSENGQEILAAHARLGAIAWNAITGKEIRRFKPTGSSTTCIALTNDGRIAASSGWKKVIRLWDFRSGTSTRSTERVTWIWSGHCALRRMDDISFPAHRTGQFEYGTLTKVARSPVSSALPGAPTLWSFRRTEKISSPGVVSSW